MKPDDGSSSANSNTWNTTKSEISTNSASSNDTERSTPSTSAFGHLHSTMASNSSNSRMLLNPQTSRLYKSSSSMIHAISIGSSVTKVRWRPPAQEIISGEDGDVDRHDSMFAVATARHASAGGSGVTSLWSLNRPFMPLSVVEGHEEGAVADFVWMRTPLPHSTENDNVPSIRSETDKHPKRSAQRNTRQPGLSSQGDDTVLIRSGGRGDVESILFDNKRHDNDNSVSDAAIWQHVLSVGKDGKCFLQSFVRGESLIEIFVLRCRREGLTRVPGRL